MVKKSKDLKTPDDEIEKLLSDWFQQVKILLHSSIWKEKALKVSNVIGLQMAAWKMTSTQSEPVKTHVVKGKNCHGRKLSKMHLTVTLCANAREKLPHFFIRKS